MSSAFGAWPEWSLPGRAWTHHPGGLALAIGCVLIAALSARIGAVVRSGHRNGLDQTPDRIPVAHDCSSAARAERQPPLDGRMTSFGSSCSR
jgi:hypothetical protein